MEGKIVCFSAANKESRVNYEKTVINCVDLRALETKFSKLNIPSDIQFASVWGARWEKIWSNLSTYDITLFYAHRRFISYGTIICKFQSKEISEYLWGTSEYKNLVFMSPHIQINSCREKLWKAFNYAPGLYIQGLRIPFVKRQKEIKDEYGSIAVFLKEALDLDEMHL